MGLSVTGRCSSPLACLPHTPRSFLPSTLLHSYFGLTLCNRHDIFSHERSCLQICFCLVHVFHVNRDHMIDRSVIIWLTGNTCTREETLCSFADWSTLRVIVSLVLFSCRNSWASSRETIRKMYFGKHFWQSLACFVIGGIITVIFRKLLEWQRDYNNEERRDKRILVPVQEVGDGEGEEPVEIRKFPREHDDF